MTVKGPIVEAVDIGNVADAPFARLPNLQRLFQRRASRLKHLAEGHALRPFLLFMAEIAQAQHEAVQAMPPGTLPLAGDLDLLREHRTAPLDRMTWRRDSSWRAALAHMLHALKAAPMPEAAAKARDLVLCMGEGAQEQLALRVLEGTVRGEELALASFVAAALQAYWSRMAALLDPASLGPLERQCDCPVCASPPIASLMPATPSLERTRYLACALCATEWHYVRIKCANCESTKGIAYQEIAGAKAHVKAETCEECKTYTKIFYGERDAEIEPLADDLASLGLDVLVGDAGWHRANPNPFLLPGEVVTH
ncbi:MAG: formate dehydrogenase accessory protein FdhE [Proteobacteria bacterium]|nr:formate dehydrogenase accessory protein FdhE [Pseudomonadota bacterium]MBI3499950.1 formate dehydrogenase accessory protein FdhE [Pseudomonadota bacterium]